jgi:predicted DNA-binding transcriptional regulator YafY
LTQEQAAQLLNVTPRQVRNLVRDLEETGVPVKAEYEDRKRVYYLEPGDWHGDTVTLDLPERQLLSLLVATQAARPTLGPTPLSEPLGEASEALEEALGQSVVSFIPAFEGERWHFNRATSVDLDPEVFWTLKRAIADQHPVDVDYFSAYRDAWTRGRRIDPLLFAVRKGAWLCVVYCHHREAILDFNLVDIENVRVADREHYVPPQGFDRDEYFAGRFGALAGDREYSVKLRVEPELARYFSRKLYHPSQQVQAAEQGGGLLVSFEVQGLEEVASFVRSWGAGVTVVLPVELKERIVDDAKAILRQYDEIKTGDGGT